MMAGSNNDGVSLWQDSANCIGQEEVFDKDDKNSIASAKKFCAGCPVMSVCLEYALLYNMSGVWGGLTDKERRRRFSRIKLEMLRGDAQESGTYNYALKV